MGILCQRGVRYVGSRVDIVSVAYTDQSCGYTMHACSCGYTKGMDRSELWLHHMAVVVATPRCLKELAER